jgi:hypothetical protein
MHLRSEQTPWSIVSGTSTGCPSSVSSSSTPVTVQGKLVAAPRAGRPGRTVWPSLATRFGAQPTRDLSLNPRCTPGLTIDGYTDTELRPLARWIKSDGVLRTADELITAMMRELGFQRHGDRIVTRLAQAINQAKK